MSAADEAALTLAGLAVAALEALAIFRESLDEGHRKIAESMNLLAVLRYDQRDYVQAAALFQDVLARFRASLGDDHPDTLGVEQNLGMSLYYSGRGKDAEVVQRDLLTKLRSDDGTATDVMNLQNLARTLQEQGRIAEALPIARQSVDLQRKYTGEHSRPYALALRELAHAEQLNGNAAQAEAHYRDSTQLADELAPKGGFGAYGWKIPYADFLVGADRCAEALPMLETASKELDAAENPLPIWRPQADLLIGACELNTNQRADAKQRISAARTRLRELPSIALDLYPTAKRLFAAGQ